MNIYDFDGTIREGDCSVDFYLFNLLRHPYLIVLLPLTAAAALLLTLKLIDITAFKQTLYIYLRFINTEKMVDRFWTPERERIFSWYYQRRTDNDVLVSASPVFLLSPICEKLGIKKIIASNVDPKTGRYTGKNCSGEEKRRRFLEVYPDERPECSFYDKDRDLPVSRLADHGFRIVDGEPVQEF